jgi:predicted XRE-type DNA-binding protein
MTAQHQMKWDLLRALRDWVRGTHLTQLQAAERLGITQGHVSEILALNTHRYTAGRLLDLWETAGGRWSVALHHPDLIDSDAAPHP